MKEKILKIIEEGKKYGYSNEAVTGELLCLFGVSQRSELLAFMRFISKTPQTELELYSDEEFVDGYLKANCG